MLVWEASCSCLNQLMFVGRISGREIPEPLWCEPTLRILRLPQRRTNSLHLFIHIRWELPMQGRFERFLYVFFNRFPLDYYELEYVVHLHVIISIEEDIKFNSTSFLTHPCGNSFMWYIFLVSKSSKSTVKYHRTWLSYLIDASNGLTHLMNNISATRMQIPLILWRESISGSFIENPYVRGIQTLASYLTVGCRQPFFVQKSCHMAVSLLWTYLLEQEINYHEHVHIMIYVTICDKFHVYVYV